MRIPLPQRLAVLLAVRETSPRKSPQLAVLPAARETSPKKNLPLAVLPAELGTSKLALIKTAYGGIFPAVSNLKIIR